MIAPDVEWDSDAKTLTVTPGSLTRVNVEDVGSWEEVCWQQTFSFTATGGTFVLYIRRDEVTRTYYAVWIAQDGTVTIRKKTGVFATTIATTTLSHLLPVGESTHAAIYLTKPCQGRLKIVVSIYGPDVLTATVDEPDVLAPNDWMISAASSDVVVDNVVAYEIPVAVDEVRGPGDTVEDPVPNPPVSCIVYSESAFSGWTFTGLWHVTSFRYLSHDDALYFGTGESGYHTWGTSGDMGASPVSGYATSPVFDLSDYPASKYDLELTFWQYIDTRTSILFDVYEIDFLDSGSPVFNIPKLSIRSQGNGIFRVDVSNLPRTANLQIRFALNTVDTPTPGDEGWYVDDVRILAKEA